jgi:predicted nucleic acid-binding protein
MRFVDTNIPLYAISSRPAEAAKAERTVALLNAPDLALSVQVLPEFCVQATRSTAASPLSHDAAVAFIDTLRRFPVQEITVPLMQAALATRARWGISYWGATIVEAARSLACPLLLSEDLQHGQDFDGVLVQNPFL